MTSSSTTSSSKSLTALFAALTLPVLLAAPLCAADVVPAQAEAFARLVSSDARVVRLATGMQFLEGTAWSDADGGRLYFSDIPASHILTWTATQGVVVFRQDSHHANGNTIDPQGRLVTCEHGTRRVTRTSATGGIEVMVDRYQGAKFNSPNDVAVKSDGTIWFTDPPYGIPAGERQELPHAYVFRYDPASRDLSIVADDFEMPNGIAFSPDESQLYITDTGAARHIRVFDVRADGRLAHGRVFCALAKGLPDGIRLDSAGNLWTTAGEGVEVYAPSGTLLGTILVGESPANLSFGGPDHHTLFMAAHTSLYAVPVLAGPAGHP
jgi:gluconolactonase